MSPATAQPARREPLQRRYYSINEITEMIPVSRDMIHDLIRCGKLASVKIGKRRLIPVEAFEELLEEVSQ